MNYNLINNNKVYISGEVVSEPKFSHEVYNEGFYEFDLKVGRLSVAYDIIPVTISERLMSMSDIKVGSKLSGSGQFRSYNKLEDGKSKLLLTVFLREVMPYNESDNPNMIEIVGYVCKEPVYRTTPFNREITDVLLAVNRSYNKSDYLPCIAWGRNARFVRDFAVGDKVSVSGRIQSREYQKKVGDEVVTRIAYEVSLNKIELIKEDLGVDTIMTSAGEMENYYVR
ncbi:MAG: single-stranded DNA-binding protein [Clostridiales bacterium]|nr:single-stranded DNA-binding protein [Clostridiales bacterium]